VSWTACADSRTFKTKRGAMKRPEVPGEAAV
jgi:hypothetical protein